MQDSRDKEDIPKDLPEDPAASYDPFRTRGIIDHLLDRIDSEEEQRHRESSHENPQEGLQTFSVARLEPSEAETQPGRPAEQSEAYLLCRLVAKGGYGEVWQSMQTSLSRVIAVKRLRQDLYEKRSRKEIRVLESGFRHEALISAKLDHPNIVPVYDLGIDQDGRPLLAMKLVRGEPWSDVISRDFEELSTDELLGKHLPTLIQVSHAVAFAHSRGIVHRDVKPSQVMLGKYGEVLLMDWGIAFVYDRQSAFASAVAEPVHDPPLGVRGTATNPAGTPAYMAPEQTRKNTGELGPWTDVYLLGGILYYLLTGEGPNEAPTSEAAFHRARYDEVVAPQERAPFRSIPGDLADLCLRALQRDITDRIRSADEFATALKDYITGTKRRRESKELVARAREDLKKIGESYAGYGEVLEHLRKAQILWPQNPVTAPLAEEARARYASAALRNGDLVMARIQAGRLEKDSEEQSRILSAITEAEALHRRQEKQRRLALAGALVLGLLLVIGAIKYSLDQKQLSQSLAGQRDRAEAAALEAEKAEAEAVLQKEAAETAHREAEQARQVAEREQYYSSIGIAEVSLERGEIEKTREILMEGSLPAYRQWEWGYLLAQLYPEDMRLLNDEQMFHAVYSPDGSHIATGDLTGMALWEAESGRRLWHQKTNDRLIWSIDFSRDGKWIFGASFDKTGVIIDAQTGELQHRLTGHSEILRTGGFSADSSLVFTGSGDTTVRIYDRETGNFLRRFIMDGIVYTGEFDSKGEGLIIGLLDGQLLMINPRTGETIRSYESHEDGITSAKWDQSGDHIIATTNEDGLLVYTREGEVVHELRNPTDYLHSADFSPAKDVLVSADDRGYARFWSMESGNVLGDFLADDPMWRINFSPDGQKVLSTSRRSVRLTSRARILEEVEFDKNPSRRAMQNSSGVVEAYGLPPDRHVAWGDEADHWIVPSGATLAQPQGGNFLIETRFSSFSPDRKYGFSFDKDELDGEVRNVETGDLIRTIEPGLIIDSAFSPDGRYLAVAEFVDNVHLFDTETWELVRVLDANPTDESLHMRKQYSINDLQFSPNGETMAVGYLNGEVWIWSVEEGKAISKLTGVEGAGIALDYSHDGRLLASGTTADTAVIWDLETGELMSEFTGHRRTVIDVDFSPDGRRLLTTSADNSSRLWSVRDGREIMTLIEREQDERPLGARFTNDGMAILIPTRIGELEILEAFPWNMEEYPGGETKPLEHRIELWKRRARVSPETQWGDLLPEYR